MNNIEILIKLLSAYKFSLNTEDELKLQMAKVLDDNQIPYIKEHRLDAKNRVDFFIYEHAIEVKVKGGAKKIFRQCERYCGFDTVKGLVLVTNKSMGFPEMVNGKPCYVMSLGKSWL